jgi:hypothetical protein
MLTAGEPLVRVNGGPANICAERDEVMAGRKKEVDGLGKTARSSTVFDREAGNRPTGHNCTACQRPITVREHLPVMAMPGRKMRHYHRNCYGMI